MHGHKDCGLAATEPAADCRSTLPHAMNAIPTALQCWSTRATRDAQGAEGARSGCMGDVDDVEDNRGAERLFLGNDTVDVWAHEPEHGSARVFNVSSARQKRTSPAAAEPLLLPLGRTQMYRNDEQTAKQVQIVVPRKAFLRVREHLGCKVNIS
jgi:hypothetical protein